MFQPTEKKKSIIRIFIVKQINITGLGLYVTKFSLTHDN